MIKIVNGGYTDGGYTEADLEEMGAFARKNTMWRIVQETASKRAFLADAIDVFVAIASPDGEVAAWFGRAPYDASKYGCAAAATGDFAFSMYWDAKNGLGGARDGRALAEAAGRLLHARTFGHEEDVRDQFLVEWIHVPSKFRPDTAHLLNATSDALAAASAMLVVREFAQARQLLADVRALGRPTPKKRAKRARVSRAVLDAVLRPR